HFVSGFDPDPAFRAHIAEALGEVIPVREPAAVVSAAVASSAIPGIFEPVRIEGRDFVDPGGFSNQPLHAAIVGGADAAIIVLLAPSGGPPPAPPARHPLGARGRPPAIAQPPRPPPAPPAPPPERAGPPGAGAAARA